MKEISLDHIAKPNRPMAPFGYYGGKGNLAKWVLKYFPEHNIRTYVEPYCGAASLFWHLQKPYPVEVLNDLDDQIVNLFRVLQDKRKYNQLAHRLIWTPYSLSEFNRAIEIGKHPEGHNEIDLAWSFFVRQNQGFGGNGTGFGRVIASNNRGMAGTANHWRNCIKLLEYFHDRLTMVQIDHEDALKVIQRYDTERTLFYVDPPYILSTRKERTFYTHEQDDNHHRELVKLLLTVQGKVVLSGYEHDIYQPLTEAWYRYTRETASYAAGRTKGSGLQGKGAATKKVPRTEVLWCNFTNGLELK